MTGTLRHISARDDHGVLILTIELKRVSSYELAEGMGRELLDAVKDRLGLVPNDTARAAVALP
jgi:hypothetical protein